MRAPSRPWMLTVAVLVVAAIVALAQNGWVWRRLAGNDVEGALATTHASYVGKWRGSSTELDISPAGRVWVRRMEGHVSTKGNGSIYRADAKSLAIVFDGIPVTTTFEITQAPAEVTPGHWEMTLDGIVLRR